MNQLCGIALTHQFHPTIHALEVTHIPVLDTEIGVPKVQDRLHPRLLIVVLDHGLHGLILRNHGAYIATKPAVTTAWRRVIDNDRALSIRRGTLVDTKQLLVIHPPRVFVCEDVHPYVVAGPGFDWEIDPHAR
ncbi:hypothetical protein FQZ97_1085900 [compost metagenome]